MVFWWTTGVKELNLYYNVISFLKKILKYNEIKNYTHKKKKLGKFLVLDLLKDFHFQSLHPQGTLVKDYNDYKDYNA